MKKLKLEVAGITDVGTDKEVNEDAFVYKVVDAGEHVAGIFAVADGVGGLEKGEVASSVAISNINKWWKNDFKNHYDEREYLIESLIVSFQTTNQCLINIATKEAIKIATTLTVLFIYKGEAIIVHVGDSRIYKYENVLFSSKVEQITKDHSCIISKNVGDRIIKKSVLTECLGNKEKYNHYCTVLSIRSGDIFVVCSDGVYKTMTKDKIAELIKKEKNNMEALCQTLIDTVKANGERDNISVIAIKIVK